MSAEKNNKIIGYYLERTSRIVKLAYSKALKDVGLNITPEQWVILDRLYVEDGQSQAELANGSFKNAPTISRILDLLGEKGFTVRKQSSSDRRKFKIFLTHAGKDAVEKSNQAVTKLREGGWNGLNDADYSEFKRILNQIFANLDENESV